MLTKLRLKIRALCEDFLKSDFQLDEYTTSGIFTLAQENIEEITKVLINGVEAGSGDWSFDDVTNKITITATLASGDKIETDYTFYQLSNSEVDQYIRGALIYISIYADDGDNEFELETSDIQPTPNKTQNDLIAIVASIQIKPEFKSYKLGDIVLTYPEEMTREQRIAKIINRYQMGKGFNSIINWDIY